MTDLPGRPTSLWIDTAPATDFPPLSGDLSVDVAVIGAGIAGVTAALLLAEAGRQVAVIEASRVGRQVTGHTTGKVTSQHGLIYAKLARNFGEDGARLYAEANQHALARIAELIAAHDIACGFERQPAYTYATGLASVAAIREEVAVAERLGLPASFVHRPPLPFPTEAALRFEDQAQFNAAAYVAALAEVVVRSGGRIFEQTRALAVEDGTPCLVTTERGRLRARDVILATNMPFLMAGQFFAKAYPIAHLVIAAPIAAEAAPEGMFVSADAPSHSVRTAPHDGGPHEGGRMLVLAGPSFKPGHEADVAQGYRHLIAFGRRHFPITDIAYRWFNEDYQPMDGVPFIGRAAGRKDHVHVATGFNAWGLTTSMVAAEILTDLILERPNPWATLFDATRIKPAASAKEFVTENFHVARHWMRDRLRRGAQMRVSDLAPGEAAILNLGGEKVAAFRDEGGKVHAVSAICTHLGCDVSWNNAERSWDCACHGSRFDHEGRVIHGPAVRDLAPKPVGDMS